MQSQSVVGQSSRGQRSEKEITIIRERVNLDNTNHVEERNRGSGGESLHEEIIYETSSFLASGGQGRKLPSADFCLTLVSNSAPSRQLVCWIN